MASEWDDNPEWTDEEVARARPAEEVHGVEGAAWLVRGAGRPPLPIGQHKQRVTIRLSPDVLDHYRRGGRGWQTRLEATLRSAMRGK